MDGAPGDNLLKEVRETFLLLGILTAMLGGYLGLALALFEAVG